MATFCPAFISAEKSLIINLSSSYPNLTCSNLTFPLTFSKEVFNWLSSVISSSLKNSNTRLHAAEVDCKFVAACAN